MRRLMMAGLLAVMGAVAQAATPSVTEVPVQEEGVSMPVETPRRPAPAIHPDGVLVPVRNFPVPDPRLQGPSQTATSSEDPVPVTAGETPPRDDPAKSGAAPTVMDDFYTVPANTTTVIPASAGILSNDYDPEGDSLEVNFVYNSTIHGSLAVYANGRFVYTPDANFVGYDSFDPQITDGTNNTALSRTHLQVVATDRAPVAHGEIYNVVKNGALDIPPGNGVLANDVDPDGDALTVSFLNATVYHGTLNLYTTGDFTYVPDFGYAGPDSFTYIIYADGLTDMATTRIMVYEGNREPIATEDHYYVPTNGFLSVSPEAGMLHNDFDPDGSILLVNSITDNVDHGFLTSLSNGSFEYSPFIGYSGLDSFTYRTFDSGLTFATATVTIFVGISENDVSAVDLPTEPALFGMSLPAPNPFNPTTRIDFRLEAAERTTLRVYDVRGSLVRTLVDEELPAGGHSVQWDGRNDRGAPVASGTYFAALSSGAHHASRRLALVK